MINKDANMSNKDIIKNIVTVIRKDIKYHFPYLKFYVTGRCEMRVINGDIKPYYIIILKYVDGMVLSAMNNIVKKYHTSQEDKMYSYIDEINIHRRISDDLKLKLLKEYDKMHNTSYTLSSKLNPEIEKYIKETFDRTNY